jgi:hypothetical protein
MINSFMTRVTRALKAFRENYVASDPLIPEYFEDFDARRIRYDIAWASYENTAYRDIHKWAVAYRTRYGLYKYIRNLYNPSFRLTEFWKMMLWGGSLSPEAAEEGAIPIENASAKLRDAIAKLWADSQWSTNKDIVTMWGTTLGDVGIKILDDPDRGRVELEVIHPSTIKSLTLDNRGIVKGYSLEEPRLLDGQYVMFREEAEREPGSDAITFSTYLNDVLYPWNGKNATWTAEYGFVPFVAIQHNRVGFTFGWSELHPQRSRIHELDDAASLLHDYIRTSIRPVWMFNFRKPKNPIDMRSESATATTDRPDPGREEVPAIYVGDVRAKGQPLVTDMVDVEKVGNQIKNLIAELEREMPELQMDIWTVGGYTTGKALRTARQRVEHKVLERRPNYDESLMRAHHMAIAIGGERGYEGYEGFNLQSFKAGELDHQIPADRPIFNSDALETVDVKKTFWSIVVEAKDKGLPVNLVLRDLGWSQSKVDAFMKEMPEEPSSVNNNPTDASGNLIPDATSKGVQDVPVQNVS